MDRYEPVFFTEVEWAFVLAACDLLIPRDDTGPGAIDLGVPEFLDRHMQTAYAAGALWYREGPYFEAGPEFGYQGGFAPREIIRVGIAGIERHCRHSFAAESFAKLEQSDQISIVASLERGEIELDGVSSKFFFSLFLAEVRLGFFSDPIHGGNRDMGSWKMIGYPGLHRDYRRWIEVHDKPFPLSPVGLSSRKY